MSNVITASKTQATSLLSLQSIAASTVIVGAGVDVSDVFACQVFIHFGRTVVTAAGAGVNFRIDASAKALASANGFWFPLVTFTSNFAVVTSEPVTTSSASGQAVVSMSATNNMAVGSLIGIVNATVADSEFHWVKSLVASTSITLEDNLNFTQQTSAVAFNGAEMYTAALDLSAIGALRVVADGSGFTQAFLAEAFMTTLDSIIFT